MVADQPSSPSLWLLFDMFFFSAGDFLTPLGSAGLPLLLTPHFLSRKRLLLHFKENRVYPAASHMAFGF